MSNLAKTHIACSPLTGAIHIIRVGKQPHIALDKREAEAEFMGVLIQHMQHGIDDADKVRKTFTLGDESYELTLKRIPNEEAGRIAREHDAQGEQS